MVSANGTLTHASGAILNRSDGNGNCTENDYLMGGLKKSPSTRVIAQKPCCECNLFQSEPSGKPAPICVLFSVFILASVVVVGGIMFYLRGGKKNS
jgi:hypothetical protein